MSMFNRKRFQVEDDDINIQSDLLEAKVIKMNPLRSLLDNILSISEKDSIALREAIFNPDNRDSNRLMNYPSWKVALIAISERRPQTLVMGVLAFVYIFVYAILKMTVLM